MRIGVILDSRAPASELAELGRLAEAQGLSAVWTSSLIDARDPFTNLAPLATTTHGAFAGQPWSGTPASRRANGAQKQRDLTRVLAAHGGQA